MAITYNNSRAFARAQPNEVFLIGIHFRGRAEMTAVFDRTQFRLDEIINNMAADGQIMEGSKQYPEILREFDAVRAQCLMPAAKTAEKVIKIVNILAEQKLRAMPVFDESLSMLLLVAKSAAKEVANVINCIKGIEKVYVDEASIHLAETLPATGLIIQPV